ncbi:hypothetical protein [Lysobacter panacisoli]|uniref:Secreted protein n=1 Tax=Lysobacter panacisoli TaxID=1255263 RepID=A0ABP9L977_9GAMM|nr:hypothetical protein [Lysobacter panacisoli]
MRLLTALLALSLSTLAACAAPPTDTAQAQPPAASVPVAKPAPATASAPVAKLDRSCATDADCTVKNVGNCCGALPSCVNVNSPTDPEGVQRECARSGRMSVCGFKPVEGCQCVKGQCTDKIAEVEQVH